MSWLYEKTIIDSEKNGRISTIKFLGRTAVYASVWDQSTPYTNKMWAKALSKLPEDFAPKKILLLGLGGGGIIPTLQKRFRNARITAVEWDDTMIEISKKVLGPAAFSKLEILEEDAELAVKNAGSEFDLVMLDLFKGHDVAAAVSEEEFIKNIFSCMQQRGYFLANLFSEPGKTELIEKFFKKAQSWKYRYNNLALYRRKDWRAVPNGYMHYRSSSEFLKRDSQGTRFKYIEAGNAVGTVADYGFIQVARFVGDHEPVLSPSKLTFAIWQQTVRDDKVKGWRRSWDQMGTKRSGFAEIKDPQNYWLNWESHAKRQRQKWQKEKNVLWEIYQPSLEEFIQAYRKIKFDRILRELFISLMKSRVRSHGELVRLLGARKILPNGEKGELAAGFAFVDVPEIKLSYHLISFHNNEARTSAVGTGLIDEWFQLSIAKGIRFLDFCVFWAPGEDKKWKGFSRFKAQFGVQFIDNSRPLIRFFGAKKAGK